MQDFSSENGRAVARAALWQEQWLSKDAQRQLVAIARSSIDAPLKGRSLPQNLEVGEELTTSSFGAFVSLYRDRALRGCIGHCFPQRPLFETVMEMASAAATKDLRFPPVTADEVSQIAIEISVLSPLRELAYPLEVEVGRHGLYIVQGNRHGVLLPQVAVDQGWDKRAFLEAACMKAGLMASSWEMIGTRVMAFTVQLIVEEKDQGKRGR